MSQMFLSVMDEKDCGSCVQAVDLCSHLCLWGKLFGCETFFWLCHSVILHSYHNPIVFQSLGVNVNLNLFLLISFFFKCVCVYENCRSIVYGDFPWNWSFSLCFPAFFFKKKGKKLFLFCFASLVWILKEKKIYGTNRPFRLPSRFWNWSCFTVYLLLVYYLASKWLRLFVFITLTINKYVKLN